MPSPSPWPGFRQRIHIVGVSPRTGTTLMARLMVGTFGLDDSKQHETAIYHVPKTPCGILCTKRPRDILHARIMLRLEPRLWVICMLRDPRDVIVSRHELRQDVYWTYLGRWKAYHRAYRSVKHHPRVISLRYEDLVRDPDGVQKELARRMPFLQALRPFSTYPEGIEASTADVQALRGLRQVENRSVGAWRSHPERIRAEIRRNGGIQNELEELGYETDTAWESALSTPSGSTPDPDSCALPLHDAKLRQRVFWGGLKHSLLYLLKRSRRFAVKTAS